MTEKLGLERQIGCISVRLGQLDYTVNETKEKLANLRDVRRAYEIRLKRLVKERRKLGK